MLDSKKFTLGDLKKDAKIYFIGIGGISMNGLARLAKAAGFTVGGSDNHPGERTEILEHEGIRIYGTQVASNIDDFKGIYEPVGDGAYAYCEIFTDVEGKPYLSSYDGPVALQVAEQIIDPEPSGPTM